MKLAVISDLHGYLPPIEPCDVVCICGDTVPLRVQYQGLGSMVWLKFSFIPWVKALPCEKVIMIGGNHDFLFYRSEEPQSLFGLDHEAKEKIVFLQDSEYEYEGIKFYGTPWCKQFGNWAYMLSDVELKVKYADIPYKVDVLLTHDQPYGYGDILLDNCPWADGKNIGNKPLLDAIIAKQPKYQFNGHLHSCDHSKIDIKGTTHCNVSLLNEEYQPVYKPLYIEI